MSYADYPTGPGLYMVQCERSKRYHTQWVTDTRVDTAEEAVALGNKLYVEFERKVRIICDDDNGRVIWRSPRKKKEA